MYDLPRDYTLDLPIVKLAVCSHCGDEYAAPEHDEFSAGQDQCPVCYERVCDPCLSDQKCHRNQCETCLDWYEETLTDVDGEMMCGECAANQ